MTASEILRKNLDKLSIDHQATRYAVYRAMEEYAALKEEKAAKEFYGRLMEGSTEEEREEYFQKHFKHYKES